MRRSLLCWFSLALLALTACSPPVAVEQTPTSFTTVVAGTTAGPDDGAPVAVPPVEQSASAPTSVPLTPTPVITPTPIPTPLPNTLAIYTDDGGAGLDFLQRVAAEWSATSGWVVTIIPKAPDALRFDFELAALANQSPDLLIATNDSVVQLGSSGSLQAVDGWFDPAQFVGGTVAAANVEGKQWGMPISAGNQLLLLYNKKLIGAAPATTDDLLRTAKPEAAEATFITNLNDPRWLVPWLIGFNGRVLGDDQRPTLNTPEMVSTYDFLRRLRADNVNPEIDFATGSDLFKAGRAAMIMDGDWSVPWYQDAAAAAPDVLDLGVAPLPVVSPTNRQAASYVGGRYVFVPAGISDARLEQVRSFSDYLTSAAVQARVASELHRLPARAETLASEAVQNDPILKPQADNLAGAVAYPTQWQLAIIWNIVGSRTGAVMVGEIPPQTAAEEIQSEADFMVGQ